MAEPDTGRASSDAPDDRVAPSTEQDVAARSADEVDAGSHRFDAADDAERDTAVRRDLRDDEVADADADRTGAVVAERSDATRVVRPTEAQPVLEPAASTAPEPPRRQSNRLAGTAWVLLAAGLFQVVYFGAVAALVALLAGPAVVGAQLAQYAATPFAWLPVLFFFLLFELTVLIFNRAGRFLYVVASLIVGVLVYVLSVLLITMLVRGGAADRATLEQSFLSPLFVLTGLAAREVMLWTGVAIGARGTRLRTRNRAARQAYRAELEEQQHAV